jgi:hypothetical protein
MFRWILIVLGKLLEKITKVSTIESLDYYEFKKHKPWFDEGCSKFLDHWKDAQLQWLQDPSKINGGNKM